MKRYLSFITIGVLLMIIFLTGCWDQRLLRDHSLILAMGYDREENEQLLKTVVFPKPTSVSNSQNDATSESRVVSTTGNTLKDAEKKMDQTIPEQFDRSKTRIILFGEELATDGIFSMLDSLYRDLRGPLNANVAIFAGDAKDAFSIKEDNSLFMSDMYADLLDSAEQSGIIKKHSVQTASPVILAQGIDLVLPYIALDEKKDIQVDGLALFHGDEMTGTLDLKETILFLMLSNQISKNAGINLQVSDDKEDPIKNFVNISIRSNKRKIDVDVTNEAIKASVHIDLRVEIDEFAEDHLDKKNKIKKLEENIQKELQKIAERTIKKMQEASNDSLGIGEKLRAFHPTTWKSIDWAQEYPSIPFNATFSVDIIHHGIIN